MIDILTLSIGVGLVVSLLFAEFYGFKAGGLVVPGYFALYITDPMRVVLTLAIAVATFVCVRLLSSVIVVYGKRRTALAILIGYIIGATVRMALHNTGSLTWTGSELEVIGFIIPGLIALWMDRQGILETVTSLVTVSAVARLVLILLVPTQMEAFHHQIRAEKVTSQYEMETES